MKLPVVFRDIAEQELRQAHDWYEVQQAGLGSEFSASIFAALDDVCESPIRFPATYRVVRRIHARRFPITNNYRVMPGEIVVLAVFHGRRDPKPLKRS